MQKTPLLTGPKPSADWAEIQSLSIAGVSDKVLAERFNVAQGSIRRRRSVERWPMPDRVFREQQSIAKRAAENDAITKTAAQSLLERGEIGSAIAQKLALSLLRKATVQSLEPLKDIGDVSGALNVVRKAAAMDKEGQQVSVNLAMFGSGPRQSAARVIDSDDNEDFAL